MTVDSFSLEDNIGKPYENRSKLTGLMRVDSFSEEAGCRKTVGKLRLVVTPSIFTEIT